MRLAWERIIAITFSGAAWLVVLLAGAHLAHMLRPQPRVIAHASARRRDQG